MFYIWILAKSLLDFRMFFSNLELYFWIKILN